MFIKVLSTPSLLGCSFIASANIYNLQPDSPQFINYSTSGLSFNDQFTFTVPANDVGAATAIKFDLSIGSVKAYGISDLMVTPMSTPPAGSTFTFNPTYDNSNAITGYQSNQLTAGSYEFDVSGTTAGLSGGNYTAGFSVIPAALAALPGAVWLFGSVLLGFTGLNRRKQAIV